MSTRSLLLLLAPSLLGLFLGSADAQQQRSGRPGDNSKPLPLQGKDLPAVTAFSVEGEAVELRKTLKGKHGVIVFGCLT